MRRSRRRTTRRSPPTQPLVGYNLSTIMVADVPQVPARRPPLALADAARRAHPVLVTSRLFPRPNRLAGSSSLSLVGSSDDARSGRLEAPRPSFQANCRSLRFGRLALGGGSWECLGRLALGTWDLDALPPRCEARRAVVSRAGPRTGQVSRGRGIRRVVEEHPVVDVDAAVVGRVHVAAGEEVADRPERRLAIDAQAVLERQLRQRRGGFQTPRPCSCASISAAR